MKSLTLKEKKNLFFKLLTFSCGFMFGGVILVWILLFVEESVRTFLYVLIGLCILVGTVLGLLSILIISSETRKGIKKKRVK